MKPNASEILFEEFCVRSGIKCLSVARERNKKTPDYELIFENLKVVVEIKEIRRNKEEIESDRLLEERGYGNVTGGLPGQRVRLKIQDCSDQIKARSYGFHPSLLVVYEEHFAGVNIDPYHIQTAMYGLETFDLAIPEKGKPYLLGNRHGSRQKMTPKDNTSISAIATLQKIHTGQMRLIIYHNKYATIPLPTSTFEIQQIYQFRLGQTNNNTFPKWERAVS